MDVGAKKAKTERENDLDMYLSRPLEQRYKLMAELAMEVKEKLERAHSVAIAARERLQLLQDQDEGDCIALRLVAVLEENLLSHAGPENLLVDLTSSLANAPRRH